MVNVNRALSKFTARLSPAVLAAGLLAAPADTAAEKAGGQLNIDPETHTELAEICGDFAHLLYFAESAHLSQKPPAPPVTMLKKAFEHMRPASTPDFPAPQNSTTKFPEADSNPGYEDLCRALAPEALHIQAQHGISLENSYKKALEGIVSLYDMHTELIEPETAQSTKDGYANAIVGTGVFGYMQSPDDQNPTEKLESKVLKIVDFAAPDTPAERAGLRRGDLIHEINGTPLNDLSIEEIKDFLSGNLDSIVHLSGYRPQDEKYQPISIEIKVGYYLADPTQGGLLTQTPNTAYLHLKNFQSNAADSVYRRVQTFKEKADEALKYLILDLKGNTGGYTQIAADIVDFFVESNGKGPAPDILSLGPDLENADKIRVDAADPRFLGNMNIYVLTDAATASSAEIVADGLRQLAGATVIGTRTWGKQVFTQSHDLSKSMKRLKIGLKYSEGYFFIGPNQSTTGKDGLQPDIRVQTGDMRDQWDRSVLRQGDFPNALVYPEHREAPPPGEVCRLKEEHAGELDQDRRKDYAPVLQETVNGKSFVDAGIACALAAIERREGQTGAIVADYVRIGPNSGPNSGMPSLSHK